MAHSHTHDHKHEPDEVHQDVDACCAAVNNADVEPTRRRGRAFKVRGMDCAEEVAVLKQAVGPDVGGAERLAFDVLNGRMTVAEAAGAVPD